jgi:glycosyltransferase involved in cell wall biosynthesis
MTLYDKVEPEKLIDFYKNAKVYCQLSRSESFGVSILEAMTFGEFPVVTREGGMPEVVGDFGSVVERDPKLIAELIEHRILKDGIPNAAAIEMHIEKLFTKKLRAESLLQIIDTV